MLTKLSGYRTHILVALYVVLNTFTAYNNGTLDIAVVQQDVLAMMVSTFKMGLEKALKAAP